ncbi:MAG: SDR family oxidoreductase [Devosia sp.]|uniref:SDR family oxidoreductase n=1 Tax=Devosia sp. TaxID=1871048 RepID=UPI001A6452A0|nr:SDR family oxidoreductase [Devosia sp.]MBL8598949.1 SDR family oxidoreductase [Devosia sp.]
MTDKSKVAVVTGAGSGIGRAVATMLHANGYDIALAGRRRDSLEETAAQLKGSGRALVRSTDVTDAVSVAELFRETLTELGGVQLLFNNAGIAAPSVPFDELDPAALRSVIDINVLGACNCAREAMRVMKSQERRGGRIINNGSVSAYAPRPNSSAYTTSKHAITGLTKSIALDGRKFGIVCGQIDIGNAVTEMSDAIGNGTLQADGAIMAEPRMAVENVARAVLFMDSLTLDANIPFLTIMASNMPLFGRG